MKLWDLASLVLESSTPITNSDPDKKNSLRFYPKHPGIFVPDNTLRGYIEAERKSKEGFYALQYAKRILINKGILKSEQCNIEIYQAAFYLLHEEGHWIQFKKDYLDCNKVYQDFIDDYYKEKNECEKRFIKKYDHLDIDKKHEIWAKEYRANRFEEYADKYAIKKMKDKVIIEKLKAKSDIS